MKYAAKFDVPRSPVLLGTGSSHKREDHMNTQEKWMKEAIKQAKKAYEKDEVPIGCVIEKIIKSSPEDTIKEKCFNKAMHMQK